MIHRIVNKELRNLTPEIIEPIILKKSRESATLVDKHIESKNTIDLDLPIKNYITHYFNQVYSVPFYTKKFIDTLLKEIKEMEKTINYEPNLNEDELRRSPEILLNLKCPELMKELMNSLYDMATPIFYSVFGRTFFQGTVHVTKYDSTWKGNWHHDAGNISFVVPLNTGEYEGGGTQFHDGGVIEPLPTGHGLFHSSFSTLHKGLPITKGERYLLVFWLN